MTPSTTSKELSERLKALGVKQQAVFYWVRYEEDKKHYGDNWHIVYGVPTGTYDTSIKGERIEQWLGGEACAAFTAGELGEILPKGYWTEKTGAHVAWRCDGGLSYSGVIRKHPPTYADTEAEARGLVLEYLLTNGLL